MSKGLVEFAMHFTERKVSADTFVDEFTERWKQEGADGRLLQDPPEMSDTLSTIFCFADLYNPDPDREEYEFDEDTLRNKVHGVLNS